MENWCIVQKKIYAPQSGRVFFMGDLHGHYDLLEEKLELIDFDSSKDVLIACGDLVDRGPHSLKSLKLLDQPWFYSVVGNHEIMAIEYYEGQINEIEYHLMGGRWFIDLPSVAQAALIDLIKRMPLSIEVEMPDKKRIGVVHAEPPESWKMLKKGGFDFSNCVWSRDKINLYRHGGLVHPTLDIDAVVCGHSFAGSDQPLVLANQVYIDTGACSMQLKEAGSSDLTLITANEVLKKVAQERKQHAAQRAH